MNQIAPSTAGTLRTNLRGQLRQTVLPKWKALLPLYEAVMNSFHAIEEAGSGRPHRIVISVRRETDILGEENAKISGFEVSDTGVGFDDDNFDSFNTAYSEHKVLRGGKGLGRFMWLKAFDDITIASIFTDTAGGGPATLWERHFRFDTNYDPDSAPATQVEGGSVGTRLTLGGFREPFRNECPQSTEQLAQRLAEHFILVLMQPGCPIVEIHDQSIKLSLNEFFRDHFRQRSTTETFDLSGREFQVHGFRLTAPRASKHRLIYAANSRGVVNESLEQYVPNLTGRLVDEQGESFVYLAVVRGDYLDEKVNNQRTDFEMHEDIDEDQVEMNLGGDEIRRADIRVRCIDFVEKDLRTLIRGVNEGKKQRILAYVQSDAPQYKPLLKYLDTFIGSISPNASRLDIELALHRELHQREASLKREGNKILTEAAKQEDYEGYSRRLAEFMERSNELGTAALAQYVMHRKIVLELFERALSSDKKTDRYPLEAAVHNILFPMRSTDRETLYSQQNLWIIDERLTYHSFIASDKTLSSNDEFQSTSKIRPDLFIFDRKLSFAEGAEGEAVNSIAVVEFKRPQRDDYTDEENPLKQVIDQVKEIRSGTFKNEKGRPIRVANERIPAFAYVVCDITPSMRQVMIDRDAKGTPDGLMYYGYHDNHGVYYEVIDYSRLLSDSKRRNRVFFDRLNLLST